MPGDPALFMAAKMIAIAMVIVFVVLISDNYRPPGNRL